MDMCSPNTRRLPVPTLEAYVPDWIAKTIADLQSLQAVGDPSRALEQKQTFRLAEQGIPEDVTFQLARFALSNGRRS